MDRLLCAGSLQGMLRLMLVSRQLSNAETAGMACRGVLLSRTVLTATCLMFGCCLPDGRNPSRRVSAEPGQPIERVHRPEHVDAFPAIEDEFVRLEDVLKGVL